MRLKFHRTTASNSPDYPFQAGQIITIPVLTAQFRSFLRDGAAELLPDVDDTERAVVEPARVPERERRKAR